MASADRFDPACCECSSLPHEISPARQNFRRPLPVIWSQGERVGCTCCGRCRAHPDVLARPVYLRLSVQTHSSHKTGAFAVRTKRLMVTRSQRGVTLTLVEVLLLTVMVADAASAQQTITVKPTDVVPGRADRLFFRHVTARSIYYNVPRIANDSR